MIIRAFFVFIFLFSNFTYAESTTCSRTKNLIVDGKQTANTQELHNLFSKELCFPSYYGNNFDALYDMLLNYDETIRITIANSDVLFLKLGNEDYEIFTKTLEEASQANSNIQLEL